MFDQRIKEICLKADISQADSGATAGPRESYIGEIVRGGACPAMEGPVPPCQHRNISTDYLLGFTNKLQPYKGKEG